MGEAGDHIEEVIEAALEAEEDIVPTERVGG